MYLVCCSMIAQRILKSVTVSSVTLPGPPESFAAAQQGKNEAISSSCQDKKTHRQRRWERSLDRSVTKWGKLCDTPLWHRFPLVHELTPTPPKKTNSQEAKGSTHISTAKNGVTLCFLPSLCLEPLFLRNLVFHSHVAGKILQASIANSMLETLLLQNSFVGNHFSISMTLEPGVWWPCFGQPGSLSWEAFCELGVRKTLKPALNFSLGT